jgi:cytochrome bd-type quinol oxidase subunit 2
MKKSTTPETKNQNTNKTAETKNQKISKIAAKTAIRIFVIILFVGILPFVTGNQPWDAKAASTHLVIPNKWMLIYPGVLFAGFLTLTILVLKNKYKIVDFNWLLVLNTVILLVYLVLLYSRIYKVLFM